ncbi:MAG: M56 family metallopeptidase [Lachnospiraceae bacterium]|nr:M56 family metallopeptidase [Lachnospiraceae bacterium]
MNWTDWMHLSFLSLHLGALVGTLLFQMWKGIRILMRDVCDIPLLCKLLKCVVCFYYIPFLILTIRALRVQYGYWYGVFSLERAAVVLRIPETIWLAGTAGRSLREVRVYRDSRWYMQTGSMCCPRELRAECEALRKRLGIRRFVRYRVKYMQDAAFTQGLFRPVIYLPMEGLDRQEREIVILHEMNHIRNRDALWMLLVTVLSCIYWFLPWMEEMRVEMDLWSEYRCDLATCLEAGGARIYFDVLIRLVLRSAGGLRSAGLMELCPDKNELYQRISMIRKHQKLEPRRKSAVAFISFFFYLASGVTVCVCTMFALDLYQNVSLFTTEMVCERSESSGRAEYMVLPDGEAGSLPAFDQMGDMRAASTVGLAWRMPEGVLGSSSKFRKCSGSTLSILLRIEPADAVIWAGIVDPHGNLYYISGKNVLSHTFSLTSTGYYRFFLYNHSPEKITVVGSYIR